MSWQLWIVVGALISNFLLAVGQGIKDSTKADPLKALVILVLNGTLIGLIFWGAA